MALTPFVRKWTLKKKGLPSSVILAELFPQNVLFDGTGWTGWTGGTVFLCSPLPYSLPSGSSALSLRRGLCPSLMGRVGRVGRGTKESFIFLHTLWVYRLSIYLLIHEIKIVTNIFIGIKIWCQVGGGGQKFQIYSR